MPNSLLTKEQWGLLGFSRLMNLCLCLHLEKGDQTFQKYLD